jgi:hypothetical protein
LVPSLSQLWKPVLQEAKSQLPEVQATTAFLTPGQLLPQTPQFEVDVEVSSGQPTPGVTPQSLKPAAQVPLQTP